MGAEYTKLLTYVDAGPEAPESDLKKKYVKILTSGKLPEKPNLTWKSLPLNVTDITTTTKNLKEGANFIHAARVAKQNILVCISEEDPDSIAFATAYFMILSGLPLKESDEAIASVVKLKQDKKFHKSLEAIRNEASPKDLRDQMFKAAGNYPSKLLTEDVNEIYKMASLPKPTQGQIDLKELYIRKTSDNKRTSVSSGWQKPITSPTSPGTPDKNGANSVPSSAKGRRDSSPSPKSKSPPGKPTGKLDSPHSPKEKPEFQRKRSRDSVGSDHGVELVEGSGRHVDPTLARNHVTMNDHKNEVNFNDCVGKCDISDCELVSELNSVIVPGDKTKANGQVDTKNQHIIPNPDMKVNMRNLLASSRPSDAFTPMAQSNLSDASWETLAKVKDSMNKPAAAQKPPSAQTNDKNHTKSRITIVKQIHKTDTASFKAMDEYIRKRKENPEEQKRVSVRIVRA